jgi:hypothetical protein
MTTAVTQVSLRFTSRCVLAGRVTAAPAVQCRCQCNVEQNTAIVGKGGALLRLGSARSAAPGLIRREGSSVICRKHAAFGRWPQSARAVVEDRTSDQKGSTATLRQIGAV